MNHLTLPAINVRWLVDPATGADPPMIPAAEALHRVDFPIPSDIGHAWLERLPLAEGISLFRGTHRLQRTTQSQQVPLGEFSHTFPENTLCVQTVEGGTIHHREFCPSTALSYGPGCDFFRYADEFHLIPSIEAPSNTVMTALIITRTVLTELMDEEVVKQLLNRLGFHTPPAVRALPMPLAVSAPLRAALSTQLQGAVQRMFAQSKVLEYLCALCTWTATRQPLAPRFPRLSDRLRELRDHLTHLEGQLPRLEELAVQFGMSARRLNAAFAEQYGQPIYAFIADWRLNEAYVAIRDSDVALKVLADRLGYSHVNHFNRAFRRKFGHSPGQLRSGRRGAEVPSSEG